MKVTFDLIEPNISDVDVEGARVEVTWKCPASGRDVTTSTATMAEDSALDTQVSTAVKRTLLVQLMGVVNEAIASLFGARAGAVSRAATYAANTSLTQTVTKARYTEAAKNAAIVQAFTMVEDQFRWDEDREMFVARPKT